MLTTSRSGHRITGMFSQEDIVSIKNWSTSWSLPINDTKCAHMSLGGASGNRFIIHDGATANDIPTLDLKKDLGVWITSSLSFIHHHALAAKKGFTVLNMIRRIFPRTNRDDFQQLYATYVRPLLEYASSVVHSGLQMDINCLERVQRGATRSVSGLQQYPYEERLLLLNLYHLDIRRLRGDLILAFRLFAENQVSNFLTLVGESSLRVHDKKISKPHCRTSVHLCSFAVRVIQPWNDLPQDIISAASLASSKTRLYCFLGLIKWNAILSSLLFASSLYIYIYMLLFSNSFVRVQCYTVFCTHLLQIDSDAITSDIQRRNREFWA